MPGFFVDEDLPRSLGPLLKQAGHVVEDVRDVGLRGRPDAEVFEGARARGLALLTGDVGFSNLLHFPLGTHSGIILVRLPNELPAQRVNHEILEALSALGDEEIRGNLVIIEPGRVRLRRKA
jgi:predicted nuclease of predicted toxin-antitoxin system